MLRDYTLAFVLRIKQLASNISNEVLNEQLSLRERKAKGEILYEDIKEKKKKEIDWSNASVNEKIDAAVNLLFWIRFSHYGFCKSFDFNDMKNFIGNLDNVCWDLIYTSSVLIDRKKHFTVKKGNYKKANNGLSYEAVTEPMERKGSVSPISYAHWDCIEAIRKHAPNENALIDIDGPYLRTPFGLPCDDYEDSFSVEEYKRIFEILTAKGAKAKAIVFHYRYPIFEKLILGYGFEYVDSYFEGDTETGIYSLRIDKNDIFFDSDDRGNSQQGGDHNAE